MSNTKLNDDGPQAWTAELRDEIGAWLDKTMVESLGYTGWNGSTQSKHYQIAKKKILSKFKEVERDTRSTVNSEWEVLAEGITFLRDSVKEVQNTRKKE